MFQAEITMYGKNKVSIAKLSEENPNGVIIEDKDLADSLRSLFYLIWNNLKE